MVFGSRASIAWKYRGGEVGIAKKLVNSRSLSGLDPGTAHIALLHATPLDYLKRKLNSQRNL